MQSHSASPAQLVLLALTAGCGMASNYALQPLLPQLARSFEVSPGAIGLVASAPPLGYMAGLLLLVPLGDGLDPRRLIVWQSAALAVALLTAACAPTLVLLAATSLAAGAMATVSAHCVALGARLSPVRRGRAVGTIATGIALGILLGRVFGGLLGQWLGWRLMVVAVAAAVLMAAGLVQVFVPGVEPTQTPPRMRETFRSAWDAMRDYPELRRSTTTGACWFAAFSAFWAALALHLAQPPFRYGAAAAGAFGGLGIAGALAAQAAGHATDHVGARAVILIGMAAAVASFLIMGAWGERLPAMIVGILLLDVGCFSAQAANQTRVLAIGGGKDQSRMYGAFMVAYYGAGTLGAAAGPALLGVLGWAGLSAIGVLLCACGFGLAAEMSA